MTDREKDYIRGRKPVLDSGQVKGKDADPVYHSARVRHRPLRKIVPLLAFAFIALLIAREEIPAVRDGLERVFSPAEWQAKQTCRTAAFARAERGEFARMLEPGTVNKTNDGFYIEQLLIGEMGQAGNEVAVEYSCYLDSAGQLVKLNRLE